MDVDGGGGIDVGSFFVWLGLHFNTFHHFAILITLHILHALYFNSLNTPDQLITLHSLHILHTFDLNSLNHLLKLLHLPTYSLPTPSSHSKRPPRRQRNHPRPRKRRCRSRIHPNISIFHLIASKPYWRFRKRQLLDHNSFVSQAGKG
ncbi:hypothetical protein M7I_6923 [Glarea lozoyensis 74030]|uniref:Uncharacterized protein n=1 Tax=Glarea lozoyensis (strain ATCC 74030 / MF5533) TaxID=1104152 RepID=H0EVW6_GLAL7|nr:hypothetical protein M7I_6923 [Glarea lozoyensis 74030]